MKKILSSLLILCIVFSVSACGNIHITKTDTVSFYYCRQSITYHDTNGVIAAEKRLVSELGSDLQSIITEYLSGPKSTELTVLFPKNTTLTHIQQSENTLEITLSQDCANMEELDLALACACLAKTVLPLADTEIIMICADGGFAHLEDPLIFTADSILTDDIING